MKKNLVTLLLCTAMFGIGFGINSTAFSDIKTSKVAYVDVSKLLAASKTIKSAEETRAKQTKDMLAWYNTASADIKKQSTKAGKEALIKKYEAQLTQKKKTIKDTYAKKINEVDKQLDKLITDKAKGLGYDLVFRKDALLYGGTDITDQILPSVK